MLLAFDFETHLRAPGTLNPPIVCGAFASSEGLESILARVDANAFLHYSLRDVGITFVGANIAYDWGCYLRYHPEDLPLIWKAYEECRVLDVQIASTLNAIFEGRLIDGGLVLKDGKFKPKARYSLDQCVQEWLGRTDAKSNDEWRLRYKELDGVPLKEWPEKATQYPMDDASNTLDVGQKIIEKARNLHDQPRQAWTAFCLHLGAIHGIRANPAMVELLKTRVNKEKAELLFSLKGEGYFRADGTKDTEVVKNKVIAAYHGVPPQTEKGAVSIARETLLDSGEDSLMRLGHLSNLDKLQTYLKPLNEAATTRLNTRPNVLLATGRTSYEGFLQLMPRKGGVRECFEADGIFCFADYAAIEMAGLAQVHLCMFQRSTLADAINAGQDIHSILGADLKGCGYEEFKTAVSLDQKEYKMLRQAAKAANFGFAGMMSAATFVEANRKTQQSVCEWFFRDGKCKQQNKQTQYKGRPLDVPLCSRCISQSEHLKAKYMRAWPEMWPYFEKVSLMIRRTGKFVTQLGSNRVRGNLTGPAAANTLFQGLVADGAKNAVRLLTKDMYLVRDSPLFNSRLVVFAHDETGLDVPGPTEELARASSRRQVELMIAGMKPYIPDVKIGVEAVMMKNWSKEAKPVFNEKGELCIWRPKSEK